MIGRFCATSSCTRSYRRLRSCDIAGRELPPHQRVDFSFPGRGGLALPRVPEVRVAAREPDIHLAVWIPVAAAQAEHARLVLVRRQESIEEGAQLQRHDAHAHPELLQVVLNDRRDLDPFRVARVGDDGELDGLTLLVDQRAVRLPREAGFLKQLPRPLDRTAPASAATDSPTACCPAGHAPRAAWPVLDRRDERFPRGRSRATRPAGTAAGRNHASFACNRRRRLLRQVVLVEEEKGVVESGTAVEQLVVPAALIAQQDGEIRRAQTGGDVGLARLEPHRLRVFARHEHEHDPVEIRQRLPARSAFQ